MDYRIPYPTLTRDKLSRFVAIRCPDAPKDIGGKIWDACQETDINPGMMACIGMSKSKGFTSNRDVFACHIEGTFEDQVVNAVLQYTHMKPDDLMLPQIQWTSIEIKYMGLVSWCQNDTPPEPTPAPQPKPDPWKPHPNMPDPIPQPKPEPKPSPEPPKPQNGDTQQPRKKLPWKLIATVLAAVAFGLKFVPVVPAIVVAVIDWIVKILNAIPG
jgi:hypothetical protein